MKLSRAHLIGSICIIIVAITAMVGRGQTASAPSPYMSQGKLGDFLEAVKSHIQLMREPQAVRVALLCIENEPDTTSLLGTPLAAALESAIRDAIHSDLETSTWADLRCVAGEASVVSAFMSRAARFKELSLPILWKLSQPEKNSANQGVADRLARHANHVMRRVYESSKDKLGLKTKLREAGWKDLAETLPS